GGWGGEKGVHISAGGGAGFIGLGAGDGGGGIRDPRSLARGRAGGVLRHPRHSRLSRRLSNVTSGIVSEIARYNFAAHGIHLPFSCANIFGARAATGPRATLGRKTPSASRRFLLLLPRRLPNHPADYP